MATLTYASQNLRIRLVFLLEYFSFPDQPTLSPQVSLIQIHHFALTLALHLPIPFMPSSGACALSVPRFSPSQCHPPHPITGCLLSLQSLCACASVDSCHQSTPRTHHRAGTPFFPLHCQMPGVPLPLTSGSTFLLLSSSSGGLHSSPRPAFLS